ncbi:aminotransferase class III-fold pyridoxal phosphate-dependent enzyme [Aquimarina sp. D1M17]|uniref:aminotransferase class III-fold pyridoxal phosphate-dependent enzyme n=1 Tax=Aquimarina acroporae TaxID=2937283 RepID=UPI0020BF8681|nr:aminotransferase class III-fold pyridoxal phosphate-dependent enzyme [Aquimarina acroporae]MCK8523332.1 aminotransferase class III-fold pyridoxal phosphate-dependent enzyme [Aquimarina acroporae]
MSKYSQSEKYLERALETVPLGSQTFSKSITQLPHGVSPYFASHAKGSKFWDVDGNEYIDYVNGLLSITIGHCEEQIIEAVTAQLQKGTIYSLAHELEFQVAERICKMVPCAEMVRFGKNGSDATSGAIRIARAYTGRDHILVCGYHGWQDWYIGSTTRDLGVPQATQDLTHKFMYNDIESLENKLKELEGKVAAVIMEPVNITPPKDNFLQKVKELTHKAGAVLVFDETITGFRYANGGAQEFFGVTPDLATFGKGLANGYALSAVAGKKEIMKFMEEVFFSFTFGGETLSLAAANVVLDRLEKEPILKTIEDHGAYLINELNKVITKYDLSDVFEIQGYPVWSFFVIKPVDWATPEEIKTLYLQEMFANGIFTIGTHNLSYAHSQEDIDKLIEAYALFFDKFKTVQGHKNMEEALKAQPLVPLFKVR